MLTWQHASEYISVVSLAHHLACCALWVGGRHCSFTVFLVKFVYFQISPLPMGWFVGAAENFNLAQPYFSILKQLES